MNKYIAHHGVLGQKRGVRRYQYEDGSLTPLGREHYGVGIRRYLKEDGTLTREGRERREKQKRSLDRGYKIANTSKVIAKTARYAGAIAALSALFTPGLAGITAGTAVNNAFAVLMAGETVDIGATITSKIVKHNADKSYREFVQLNAALIDEVDKALNWTPDKKRHSNDAKRLSRIDADGDDYLYRAEEAAKKRRT